MAPVVMRDFVPADAAQVDALGVAAFEQYQDFYNDWPALRERIAGLSSLAEHGEIVVAEIDGLIVGSVAYIGPGKPKSLFYQSEWAIMRMLVVSPGAQGRGIGRMLADECIRRAQRDRAAVFALHTSEMMKVALPMYLRMGFARHADAPTTYGVRYAVYTRQLHPEDDARIPPDVKDRPARRVQRPNRGVRYQSILDGLSFPANPNE